MTILPLPPCRCLSAAPPGGGATLLLNTHPHTLCSVDASERVTTYISVEGVLEDRRCMSRGYGGMYHSIHVHVRAYQRVCVNVCSLAMHTKLCICVCMHACVHITLVRLGCTCTPFRKEASRWDRVHSPSLINDFSLSLLAKRAGSPTVLPKLSTRVSKWRFDRPVLLRIHAGCCRLCRSIDEVLHDRRRQKAKKGVVVPSRIICLHHTY